MKKVIISFSLCLCVGFAAIAQDVEEEFNAAYANKRGVYLLPQAGDFALGVDASPFLRYLGNIFTSSFNPAPQFNGVDQTIYGKYFLQDNRAIRARLTFNFSNIENKGVVPNDAKIADDPDATLFDSQRLSSTEVFFGAGYELRRGNGRVQGFYGGELLFGFGSEKQVYKYANRMNEDNKTPSSYNFDGNRWSTGRTTEVKPGKILSVGLGAFAGVEYFFAPQMSLGGEFGLGFYFSSTGQGQRTWEGWNTTDNERKVHTDKDYAWDNAQDLGFLTRPSGRIYLMFHF